MPTGSVSARQRCSFRSGPLSNVDAIPWDERQESKLTFNSWELKYTKQSNGHFYLIV